MKNLMLITLLAFCLAGCSKSNSTGPDPVEKTWIEGKWTLTAYVDTTFYRDGHKVVNVHPASGELNFISNNKVTQSSTGNQQFIYSLSEMTIDFTNGRIFTITKISDTQMKLDWHYATTGTDIAQVWITDSYSKE